MTLQYPHFLVNFKIYEGTASDDGLALARAIERVSDRTGAEFVVAPQIPDLRLIAEQTDLPAVAQGIDAVEPGRGTGSVSLDAVAAAGADGALVNHAENRSTLDEIERTVEGCAERDLETIVCVDSVEMGLAAAAFHPDCLLFEKPEDIATDRAITRTHPERVEEFVAAVGDRTRVLVGGGIGTAEDVRRAFELGADAAGAASAFVGAENPEAWLSDVAGAMP